MFKALLVLYTDLKFLNWLWKYKNKSDLSYHYYLWLNAYSYYEKENESLNTSWTNGQTANKASSFSPSKRYLFAPCFKHIKLINISQIYSAVLILPYLSFVCKTTLDI